jgi:hypothetical protein
VTRYTTRIYDPDPRPRELQVLHRYPMAEPVKAEAAELGGSGPRPDQHQERNQSMSTATTWLPTRAELDEMTAQTAAVLADPRASLADRERAAEVEEKVHAAFLKRPGADAELQADAERELREMEDKEAGE